MIPLIVTHFHRLVSRTRHESDAFTVAAEDRHVCHVVIMYTKSKKTKESNINIKLLRIMGDDEYTYLARISRVCPKDSCNSKPEIMMEVSSEQLKINSRCVAKLQILRTLAL